MRFGITFYPDQWPESYWSEAFKLIKDIGFDLVRFNEMGWADIEPQEGKFDFSSLDKALNLCKKNRLKVVLGTGAAQAPQWLINKHPDILPVANDGQIHPEYGPRPNCCRDNPNYRKYALRLTEKMAKRYARHPALEMWQLDNEPTYPPLDLPSNKDWCHCSATTKAFRAWAKKKYNSIKKLNEDWGTQFWSGTFNNFNQIVPPKAGMWEGGNPHIYLDWYRFKSEQLSDWLIYLKKIIQKYDKVHKIGTNSFPNIPNRIPDLERLSTGMDWFGWDVYPTATQNTDESLSQGADYWRSLCKSNGAEFIVGELQAGQTVRWGDPALVKGEDIKKWVKIIAERGATTILFHNLRPPLYGCETAGYGLLDNDGKETERSIAVREIIREVRTGFKPVLTKSTPTSAASPIAIVYLKSSEIQTYQEEGWTRPCPPGWYSGRGELGLLFGLNSIAGAYKLVYPNQADFIFQKQLGEGVPENKILLLTNPYLLSEKQFNNIRKFVESGGILVSDSRFGTKDQRAHLRKISLIQNWLKFSYKATEIIPSKLSIAKFKSKVDGFRDLIDTEDGVLAKYSDGFPAIIEKNIGKGKVIYATFSLFSNLRHWENKNLLEFIKGRIK
ncbi:MAG: beta-galactosidase [Candidatus Saganbacteria bacterium]|nr:beta-galactosidase [Candidatus Saganbacteria bacterium]